MKKSAQIANIPLIYIDQPAFKPSLPNKQVVVVKGASKENEEKKKQEEINAGLQEPMLESEPEEKADDSDNTIENGLHKGFLNKSIEDKLVILTKLPESMPKLLCEVTTKDETYTCSILSHTEDKVFIEIPDNGETLELDKNAILSITIIRL